MKHVSAVKHCQYDVVADVHFGKSDNGVCASVSLAHGPFTMRVPFSEVEDVNLVCSIDGGGTLSLLHIDFQDGTSVELEQATFCNRFIDGNEFVHKVDYQWQFEGAYRPIPSDGTAVAITVILPIKSRTYADDAEPEQAREFVVRTYARYGWLEDVYKAYQDLANG